MTVEVSCCGTDFFMRIGVIVLLVLFAGLMSGLTLGLMSLSLVELEVIIRSGSPSDRKYAEKIVPVVQNQHLLLCTLLIWNAAAMEALPIFLDSLIVAWGAILMSVTLILLFGEIIPQAFCSRYGLAIGASVAPLVRVLVWICFPIAYPISKTLDVLLGKRHKAMFRRAELKTLVDLHGNEAGKGGELTHDETTIIAGALELTQKTAKDAMTPIEQTFTIDIDSKLDRNLMTLILLKGHSRIPVYYENPRNVVGLVLVKNLLSVNAEDEVPLKDLTIRKIPRVSETIPLYDILNEFQKGHSHMAVVIKNQDDTILSISENPQNETLREVRVEINSERPPPQERNLQTKKSLRTLKSFPKATIELRREVSKGKKWSKNVQTEILDIKKKSLPDIIEDGEAVGIITMEDVIEELLQEEIYDETDNRSENS